MDLDTDTVRVLAGATKNGEGRLIWLTDELKAMFRTQWDTRPVGCTFVFHRNGKQSEDIRGTWDRACKDAGLSGKVPHDLRRSAVRNLVRAGIPERVAMQVTGHADRLVFERYNIVSPGDLQRVAVVMSKLDAPNDNAVPDADIVANNYKNNYTPPPSQSKPVVSA